LSNDLRVIHTPLSRQPGYPFSVPGVLVPPGRALLFMQGQAALADDDVTAIVGDDVATQAEQAFKNLRTILNEAGGDLADIVHMIVIMPNFAEFSEFTKVRAKLYPDGVYPPCTGVQAGLSDPDLLIEINAVAAIDAGDA
jgi:2-iminobutanoate/2-iminopropanoate deaminase